ncbi:sorting nexin 2A-like [Zingiber officinale]|uniref:sorting nexin 2A-like n=1 Tax=Zingiber officinale TaxID=94328 RepID=UPI001C4CCA13|nr:sorting nexin 2A-like [Zingiber officinale]XP_042427190.1 sorting nexin 2A-like [Zingiber officinale]
MMGTESPPLTEEMESLALSDDSTDDVAATASSLPSTDSGRASSDPHNAASTASSSRSWVARRDGTSPGTVHAATSDYLTISVSDPEMVHEAANSLVTGSTTYVTYLITTWIRADASDGDPTEFTVRRRFRDVVTLAARISEAFPGYFIPQRPDKGIVESQMMQKHEFVEQRRAEIEKYLRKLAQHPVIGRSDELRVFLLAEGKLPLPANTDVASRMLDGAARLPKQLFGERAAGQVAPEGVVQPAKEGRDLLRIFKELKQTMSNDWGGVKPLVVEEDKEFLERKDKMQDLQQQISSTSLQAEELVKAQQDIGETMAELGMAFIKFTKFETEESAFFSQKMLAADAKRVATAAVKASRLYGELNALTIKHLSTLHEYLGAMLAVQSGFSDRASALLTVQTLMSDLSSLHSKVEKLEAASSKIFGGDQSRLQKLEELKGKIRVTEDAKSCALREYKRIKDNNRTELNRLDREKHDDFLNMLKGFVTSQVGHWEKLGNAWAPLAEETSCYARQS